MRCVSALSKTSNKFINNSITQFSIMIKTAVDLLQFLLSVSPFLVSLIVLTILCIALADNIKKHAKIYYWVMGTLCLWFAVPVMLRAFDIALPIPNAMAIPVLGTIIVEWSDAAYMLHPMLVIIMYMGAFSPKNKYVGKLMQIRKELSILTGFPFFAHISKRLFHSFPKSWDYFTNYAESIDSPRVTSVLGSNIMNGVLVLGVLMTIFFLVLWITSFDYFRKSMGMKKWKALQRWSYGLYAMNFVHTVGMALGGYLSYSAMQEMKANAPAQGHKTEMVASASKGKTEGATAQMSHGSKDGKSDAKKTSASKETQAKEKQSHGHGPKRFSFADVKLSGGTKAFITILINVLVYGSYLYFRLRKHRHDKARKAKRTIATA